MITRDSHQRPLRNLRLSVTDRCNLRCSYCMPEETYVWLPHRDILQFEEIERLVDVFIGLGVDKIRLTGGEPLLRQDLEVLVARLASRPAIRDLALTTNGVMLVEKAEALARAGLGRLTVSLDTLDEDRFESLSRRRHLRRALDGIDAAREVGLAEDLKIDTVLMRGVNDGEIADLIEFGREKGAEVRFIEYMDVGGATRWRPETVVSRDEILAHLTKRYGAIEPVAKSDWAPANRFRLPDGTVFGIIASTTAPFCATCDRSRLTADGTWYTCLYAESGTDLRAPLRAGKNDDELAQFVAGVWNKRDDRGAEDRFALGERRAMHDLDELRRDPRLEMHTRGG